MNLIIHKDINIQSHLMKILKIIVLLFVTAIGNGYSLSLPVSEYYSYHTPNYFSVFVDNEQIIFQHTVKDPNGISYVSRDQVAVDSVNAKGFELLSKSNAYLFFKIINQASRVTAAIKQKCSF